MCAVSPMPVLLKVLDNVATYRVATLHKKRTSLDNSVRIKLLVVRTARIRNSFLYELYLKYIKSHHQA